MIRDAEFYVRQVAILSVTFKESGLQQSATEELGLCVLEKSTEDLLIGKPSLDVLGFCSDKDHIQLWTRGLQFPTVLPAGAMGGEIQGAFLKMADHVRFDAPAGGSKVHRVEVVLDKARARGEHWLLPGPDLPPELQLVEGPLVARSGRATVDVMAHGTVHGGPGTRLVSTRSLTSDDRIML